MHSKEFGQLSNEIAPRPSAIPWEIFTKRPLLDLGKPELTRGRALILYPEGIGRLGDNETDFINAGKVSLDNRPCQLAGRPGELSKCDQMGHLQLYVGMIRN